MLANTETTLISTISDTLSATVPNIARHPGRWDAKTVNTLLTTAPAIYVSFSQGSYQELWSDQLLGRWHIFLFAKHLNGNASEIGIYQMIEQLLPALHGLEFGQEDVLRLKQIRNLLNFKNLEFQLDTSSVSAGISCYEMIFELPMRWTQNSSGSIDPWQRYHATHNDLNNKPLASGQAELPQGD
ncbi:phage protein Gp37 [Aliamphritea spongicola]|uniref:phage protein Gp37 n=1 Tax=Aliamphritea spongicola TaxID=707589 RepID=UPI00196A900F|nr:phage protein Gp37 [Aliamphritea spongicola]MBN3562124.1 DUF1834 family protein [Aliamphritea spongicola]